MTYFENAKEDYLIDQESKIRFTKSKHYQWYDYFFQIDFQFPTFTIALPEHYNGSLEIKTTNAKITAEDINTGDMMFASSNGSLNMDGIQAKKITLDTSNAAIRVDHIQAAGACTFTSSNGRITAGALHVHAIEARTSNAAIIMSAVETSEDATLKTSNGRIELDRLHARGAIRLTSANSSITGTLVGNIIDYSINSNTSNGSNNLPSVTLGEQTLYVKTSNGNIHLDFVS